MASVITCPNLACGRRVTLPDGAPGRRLRCPHCQTRITATETTGDGARHSGGAPAAPAIPAGEQQRVGRCAVPRRLGAGAFGGVDRAYDPHLDREVALKLPHPGPLDSPGRGDRILREAKAA